ncbi:MAG: DUF3592 domain-containing protein [Goleter apudmare HA4340-LM2]|nr:DUF3592 domain-containing protein [Goleter apudmare HA4340-LM2]
MNFKPHQSTFDDKLSAIIGLVIALIFIAVGFWVRNKVAHERATLTETQGTVVDSLSRRERDSNDRPKETYAPVIEFLIKGDRIRFTGYYESHRASKGNTVVVRYDPQQPATTARIVEPFEGLAHWMAFGMGGLLVVSSVGKVLPIRWSSDGKSDQS